MTRSNQERFDDIATAIIRCQKYLPYLESSETQTMAYDAILRNLAVIGEAVRSVPEEIRTVSPEIPWPAIAGLRNIIIHEYFRIQPTLIVDIVENHLTALLEHVQKN